MFSDKVLEYHTQNIMKVTISSSDRCARSLTQSDAKALSLWWEPHHAVIHAPLPHPSGTPVSPPLHLFTQATQHAGCGYHVDLVHDTPVLEITTLRS